MVTNPVNYEQGDDTMAKVTMTASDTPTGGQINSAVANFRAALEKHAGDFPRDAFQQALGVPNIGMILLAPLRAEVEKFSKIIRRTVIVDRSLAPEGAIAATGRNPYVTADVLASMPKGVDETVTIEFIPLEKWMSYEVVDLKLAEYDLVAVDPYALAAFNAAEPDFATKHPCFTHWKDATGNWCCAAFCDWDDERGVNVRRGSLAWDGRWWVAGVRKSALSLITEA